MPLFSTVLFHISNGAELVLFITEEEAFIFELSAYRKDALSLPSSFFYFSFFLFFFCGKLKLLPEVPVESSCC